MILSPQAPWTGLSSHPGTTGRECQLCTHFVDKETEAWGSSAALRGRANKQIPGIQATAHSNPKLLRYSGAIPTIDRGKCQHLSRNPLTFICEKICGVISGTTNSTTSRKRKERRKEGRGRPWFPPAEMVLMAGLGQGGNEAKTTENRKVSQALHTSDLARWHGSELSA